MQSVAKRDKSTVQVNEGLPGDSPSTSLCDLTNKNVEVIAQLEKAAHAQRNKADILADSISNFVGSMLFVYIHLLWFGVWIALNSVVPNSWHFDPYPFTFLTFVVSLEAIFLSTFILISQNHEELLARRRNHLDLQINLLSEQENSQILRMLANIESKLGIRPEQKERALQEDVEPCQLASQIENVIEAVKKDGSDTTKF
jgi:uncharacterized membrane protein